MLREVVYAPRSVQQDGMAQVYKQWFMLSTGVWTGRISTDTQNWTH